jgi:DNA-binding response OmpR family regulator
MTAARQGTGSETMPHMHLLLAEDDVMLGESLCRSLRREAYVVDWVRDGLLAQRTLERSGFDAVLLDLGLPRRDGMEVLRGLRARQDDTPVLILTARDQLADRVGGLDAGADDYLVKPFDLDELLARLRVLARRRAGRSQPRLQHLDVTLDPGSREVRYRGAEISLTRREYALLLALLERPGRVWSREELTQRLYRAGEEAHSNAIEVHVHALRRKLDAELIKSARGVGYFTPKALR